MLLKIQGLNTIAAAVRSHGSRRFADFPEIRIRRVSGEPGILKKHTIEA
jgi:hypothetical protein